MARDRDSDARPRRQARDRGDSTPAAGAVAVPGKPVEVVVKTTVIGDSAGYPSIDSRKTDGPSAPPPVSRDRSSSKEKRKDEGEPDRRKRTDQVDKKRRETPRQKDRRDVRDIREAEARGESGKSEREMAQEVRTIRVKDGVKMRRDDVQRLKALPVSVDWDYGRRSWSVISFIMWSGIITILILMSLWSIQERFNLPDHGVDSATYNITYIYAVNAAVKSVSSGYWADRAGATDLSIVLPPQQAPNLVTELLKIPSRPTFDCRSGGTPDTEYSRVSTATIPDPDEYKIYPTDYLGTACSQYQVRNGYCMIEKQCRILLDLSASSNKCVTPPGPRRYGLNFIPGSFVESMTKWWYIALVSLGASFILGFLWVAFTVKRPTLSPFALATLAIGIFVIVFIIWSVGRPKTETNYYLLIYAGLMLLYFMATLRYQRRIGQIFRIGCFLINGEKLEGFDEGVFERHSSVIIGPIVTIAMIVLATAFFLLFFAVASTHRLDYQQVNVGGGSTTQDNCAYVWLDKIHSRDIIIVFSVFFVFLSAYMQYAARYTVSRATADWYFMGTKAHKPLPGGARTVGYWATGRALTSAGWRIMYTALWGHLGSSASENGLGSFFIHVALSPVDALVYSPIGLAVGFFSRGQSRFGLVHSSMFSGKHPSTSVATTASSEVVCKVLGKNLAKTGDSAEVRALAFFANTLACGCGLIAWLWLDAHQQFDSVGYFGGYVFLAIWLTASGIARPGLVAMIALICDTQLAWTQNLQADMARNSLLGFIIVSAFSACIIRVFLEGISSVTDAVVYCYAMDQTRKRKLRSVPLDEMIHTFYLNDKQKIPPGHKLERVVVRCPTDAKPGNVVKVEVEGRSYDVTIPAGAIKGRDFEVAVAIPTNNLDHIEEESQDDYSDSGESEEYAGGDAVRASPPAVDGGEFSRTPPPATIGMGHPTFVQRTRI